LLHLAQSALHLLQALGHQLEGGIQARGERALQLLVHRLAHLLQLGRVVLLQRAQLLLQGGAHLADALLVARRELQQAVVEPFGEALLRFDRLLPGHPCVLAQAGAQGGQLLAEGLDARVLLAAEQVQLTADVGQALGQQLAKAGLGFLALDPALARVLGEAVTQLVQEGVGAGAQVGQVPGEAVDALALAGGQAVQLLPQLQAAIALFGTQGLLQLRAQSLEGGVRAAHQQGGHAGQDRQQQAGDDDQQEGFIHAVKCSRAGLTARDARASRRPDPGPHTVPPWPGPPATRYASSVCTSRLGRRTACACWSTACGRAGCARKPWRSRPGCGWSRRAPRCAAGSGMTRPAGRTSARAISPSWRPTRKAWPSCAVTWCAGRSPCCSRPPTRSRTIRWRCVITSSTARVEAVVSPETGLRRTAATA